MNHQVINGTSTLQHYLVSNPPSEHQNVIVMKQEQSNQRQYIINHKFAPHTVQPEASETIPLLYWLLVEIESDNDCNSYALVDSKDVYGHPPLGSLNTGKLVVVTINGKQRRATVVMASREIDFLVLIEYLNEIVLF